VIRKRVLSTHGPIERDRGRRRRIDEGKDAAETIHIKSEHTASVQAIKSMKYTSCGHVPRRTDEGEGKRERTIEIKQKII